MSVTQGTKIKDRNTEKAIQEVEKIAKEGKDGNIEIVKKQITRNDLGSLKEGKMYIDQDNNDPSIKRVVFVFNKNQYVIPLTKL